MTKFSIQFSNYKLTVGKIIYEKLIKHYKRVFLHLDDLPLTTQAKYYLY